MARKPRKKPGGLWYRGFLVIMMKSYRSNVQYSVRERSANIAISGAIQEAKTCVRESLAGRWCYQVWSWVAQNGGSDLVGMQSVCGWYVVDLWSVCGRYVVGMRSVRGRYRGRYVVGIVVGEWFIVYVVSEWSVRDRYLVDMRSVSWSVSGW